jgi:UDP-N-acetyl-D-glucosamine dehydrogenase
MQRGGLGVIGVKVAVLGLGYVGLPLVRACVRAGHTVVGFDVDEARISTLKAGIAPVDDLTDCDVADLLTHGFLPTTLAGDLTDIDVYVICVPTPLTIGGGPDLSAVEAAARVIEQRLSASARERKPLVILESTSYPGTTEDVVKPILEAGGRVVVRDFNLAFSPERIDPGNTTWTLENTPKVLGGFTPECADAAEEFYRSFVAAVVRTKGLKEAEMAKLLENTYRYINIALVNELAQISHALGIDFSDVIAAAETKPYGFQAFRPGPGVGGHCIPIDPKYLGHHVLSVLDKPFQFVELATQINASMPAFMVERAHEMLTARGQTLAGACILVLGVTYKPNIADARESPAISVIAGLIARGASVTFHDPFIELLTVDGRTLASTNDLTTTITQSDLIVILQHHSAYDAILPSLDPARTLDTRGTGLIGTV